MVLTLIASLIIISDFITKRIIVDKVMPLESINVMPFLRIVHVENKGAAFGLFSNLGNGFFIFIAAVAAISIFIYALKIAKGAELYAMALILGGAIGNLIDRVTLGKVIDFIDVFVGKWHWPAFNIADSALTVGISIFILSNLRLHKSK